MFKNFLRQLRNNLLIGLVIATPIAITIFIVSWLFKLLTRNGVVLFLTEKLLILMPANLQDTRHEQWMVQAVVILTLILALFLIGLIVRSFLGKKLYGISEMLIARIPVVNKIYIWVRQISEGFVAQRQSMFKEVVVVEYPRPGLYSLAFVTANAPLRIQKASGEEETLAALFVPTTPNPTSGMMVMAPRNTIRPISISVSDAMKLIISAGAVHPGDDLVDTRPTLLDKLEGWLARENKSETDDDSEEPA